MAGRDGSSIGGRHVEPWWSESGGGGGGDSWVSGRRRRNWRERGGALGQNWQGEAELVGAAGNAGWLTDRGGGGG